MAATQVMRSHRTELHVRGAWSARDDRTPSAVWLGVLWIGMIAGFGMDFSRFLRENPPAPKILYVHAAVFIVWLLLLSAQVLLVLGDRVAWHKKLGWFAAGWACLMAVLGPSAAPSIMAANLHSQGNTIPPPFLAVNFVDIGGFLILLAWGVTLRKNPAAHKRMMILATVALADPGFARISGSLMPAEPSHVLSWFFYTFYGNVLLIALMTGWDWWRGRLMRSFVVGAGGLLAGFSIASLLYFWEPWKAFTMGLVEAWARHFG